MPNKNRKTEFEEVFLCIDTSAAHDVLMESIYSEGFKVDPAHCI